MLRKALVFPIDLSTEFKIVVKAPRIETIATTIIARIGRLNLMACAFSAG
jgi:hypothetical protein